MRTGLLLVAFSLPLSPSLFAQQAVGATMTPQPLARDVMYRVLFRQIAAFQAQASQLAAQLKRAPSWRITIKTPFNSARCRPHN